MKFKIAYILLVIFIFATTLSNVQAEDSQNNELSSHIEKQSFAIKKIKDAISNNSKSLKASNKVIEDAKEQVDLLTDDINEVTKLIEYYDNELSKKQEVIDNLTSQKITLESDIFILEEDIGNKELELDNQKKLMMEIITLIYLNYDTSKDSTTLAKLDKNPVKLFLSKRSLSENGREETYLAILENTSEDIFDQIKSKQDLLQSTQGNLESKKSELSKATELIDFEKQNLEDIKKAKEVILSQSEREREIFQERLAFAKKQQGQITKETGILFKTLQALNSDLNEYKNLDGVDIDLFYEIQKSFDDYIGDISDDFIWPASPSAGITALFRDPSYPFKSAIGNHTGVDIRMIQGTPLLAPMNGIVTYANGYEVEEGDPNYYSFHRVVITDEAGRSVLLGHVSETFVKKGDYVEQGDLVALSGALPGTKGAGAFTTGAHLHLEFHIPTYNSNGDKVDTIVDPLLYFPLDIVPLENLDMDYLSNLLTNREDILENSE